MPQENLHPFFKYFSDEPHQAEAVQLLQQTMPDSLLKSDSAWILKYQGEAGAARRAMRCWLTLCRLSACSCASTTAKC